jgi:hypothetical protein
LFDELARRFSRTLSRRVVAGGSLGASLLTALGLGEDALARNKRKQNASKSRTRHKNRNKSHGDRKHSRQRRGANNGKRGKGRVGNGNDGKDHKRKSTRGEHNDRTRNDKRAAAPDVQDEGCTRNGRRCGNGKNLRPCSRCCSGFNITTRSKKKKCACKPDGNRCRRPSECCAGVCDQGVCGALS